MLLRVFGSGCMGSKGLLWLSTFVPECSRSWREYTSTDSAFHPAFRVFGGHWAAFPLLQKQSRTMPGLLLGDEAPNFQADPTHGPIRFHEFLGDSWGILFSHPREFTPGCTTELGRAAKLAPEFAKRNVKLIALSIDDVSDHLAWCKDVGAYNSDKSIDKLPFPIIADSKRELSVQLGMLDPDEIDKDGMPLTARVVFIFGLDKKLKLSILYPATTGRNFDEILRVVDSLKLTAAKKVATPVDWKPGDQVMVIPSLSDEEAKKVFPGGICTKQLPSGKNYLHYTSP